MTLQEANNLQVLIAESHPMLDVQMKAIEQGNAYVCFLEFNKTQYYLWNIRDWLVYRERYKRRLDVYTEEGKRRRTENWHKSRAANRARKEGLLSA